MLFVNQLNGFGVEAAAAAAAPTKSYRATYSSGTSSSNPTFATCDIGTASATRRVVVLVSGEGSAWTLSSATIAGVSATISVQAASTGSIGASSAIIIASVTSGTTGDIVLTFSTSISYYQISVYATYDLTSGTAATTASSTAVSTFSLDSNVTAGDLIFAMGHADNGTNFSWTGVTEDNDTTYPSPGASDRYSAASHTAASTESPRTISATHGGSGRRVAVAATFR